MVRRQGAPRDGVAAAAASDGRAALQRMLPQADMIEADACWRRRRHWQQRRYDGCRRGAAYGSAQCAHLYMRRFSISSARMPADMAVPCPFLPTESAVPPVCAVSHRAVAAAAAAPGAASRALRPGLPASRTWAACPGLRWVFSSEEANELAAAGVRARSLR